MFQRKKEKKEKKFGEGKRSIFVRMFKNFSSFDNKMFKLCDDMCTKGVFNVPAPPLNTESSWDGCVRRIQMDNSLWVRPSGGPAMGFNDHEWRVCDIFDT